MFELMSANCLWLIFRELFDFRMIDWLAGFEYGKLNADYTIVLSSNSYAVIGFSGLNSGLFV